MFWTDIFSFFLNLNSELISSPRGCLPEFFLFWRANVGADATVWPLVAYDGTKAPWGIGVKESVLKVVGIYFFAIVIRHFCRRLVEGIFAEIPGETSQNNGSLSSRPARRPGIRFKIGWIFEQQKTRKRTSK